MTVLTVNQLTEKLRNCTGVVLAGGQSSRMGRDKALLTWREKPLYLHMTELLISAGITRVLLNGSHDSTENVEDIYPGRGPLSGIHAALQKCQSGTLLVIPVDMPLLSPEDLVRLIDKSDGEKPLKYQGYSLPLLMPISEQVTHLVELALYSENRRDYALWRLMEKLNGQTLPAPDGHQSSFCNTNTPEEWQDCSGLSQVLQTD